MAPIKIENISFVILFESWQVHLDVIPLVWLLALVEQYLNQTIQLVDLIAQVPSHLSVNTHGAYRHVKYKLHTHGIKAPGFLLSGGEGNTGNLLHSFTASLTAQSGALVRGRLGLASMPLSLAVREKLIMSYWDLSG